MLIGAAGAKLDLRFHERTIRPGNAFSVKPHASHRVDTATMTTSASTSQRVIELPATAAAAGIARRELAATPGISGDLGYRALLMASELIAVFVADMEPHPARVLRLSVVVGRERVRIEVAGDTPDISPDALLHSRETPSLGGMGLQIVERMAQSWGVQNDVGAAIWFELMR